MCPLYRIPLLDTQKMRKIEIFSQTWPGFAQENRLRKICFNFKCNLLKINKLEQSLKLETRFKGD